MIFSASDICVSEWDAPPVLSRSDLEALLTTLIPSMSFEEVARRLLGFQFRFVYVEEVEMWVKMLDGGCEHIDEMRPSLFFGHQKVFQAYGDKPPLAEWHSDMVEAIRAWVSGKDAWKANNGEPPLSIHLDNRPWLTDNDLLSLPDTMTRLSLARMTGITPHGLARCLEAKPAVKEVVTLLNPAVTPSEVETLRGQFSGVHFLAEDGVTDFCIDIPALAEFPVDLLSRCRNVETLRFCCDHCSPGRYKLADIPESAADVTRFSNLKELIFVDVDLAGLAGLHIPEPLKSLGLLGVTGLEVLCQHERVLLDLERLTLDNRLQKGLESPGLLDRFHFPNYPFPEQLSPRVSG